MKRPSPVANGLVLLAFSVVTLAPSVTLAEQPKCKGTKQRCYGKCQYPSKCKEIRERHEARRAEEERAAVERQRKQEERERLEQEERERLEQEERERLEQEERERLEWEEERRRVEHAPPSGDSWGASSAKDEGERGAARNVMAAALACGYGGFAVIGIGAAADSEPMMMTGAGLVVAWLPLTLIALAMGPGDDRDSAAAQLQGRALTVSPAVWHEGGGLAVQARF